MGTNKTNTIKGKKVNAEKSALTSASVVVDKKPVTKYDRKRPANKKKFLAMLLDPDILGNVMVACKRLNIDRTIVYDWRKKDLKFAKDWETVQEKANDILADEAQNALLTGIRAGNPTLIIFTLKNRRPDQWKDRHELGGPGGGPIELEYELSPEYIEAMGKLIARHETTNKKDAKPARS